MRNNSSRCTLEGTGFSQILRLEFKSQINETTITEITKRKKGREREREISVNQDKLEIIAFLKIHPEGNR